MDDRRRETNGLPKNSASGVPETKRDLRTASAVLSTERAPSDYRRLANESRAGPRTRRAITTGVTQRHFHREPGEIGGGASGTWGTGLALGGTLRPEFLQRVVSLVLEALLLMYGVFQKRFLIQKQKRVVSRANASRSETLIFNKPIVDLEKLSFHKTK